MNEDNRLDLLLKQAEKAAVSRDFAFAEKILASQDVEDIAGKDNPRILFALGDLYMKAERFAEAFSIFKRLVALQPSNTEALNRIGTILRRMGELRKSLDVLLRARALGDRSSGLLYNLGNTYKEMRSYAEAEACFRQALGINPGDTLAYNHIGTIEFLRGNYKNAFEEYRKGLRSDPNHPFIHFNMARLYRLLSRDDDAESEYIAAIKSRPNWLKALSELASLYKVEGELEKRSVVLERILATDSKNLPALLDSAENAEKLNEFANARDFFARAIAAARHNPLPAEKYARFLMSAGDFANAATVIESYNVDNPDDKSLVPDLAEIYLESGRDSDAEKLLKEYTAAKADDARAWQLLARLHLERGDKEAAKEDLEKALSSGPENVKMRKELAEQLAEAGVLQEARSRLAIYSKDKPDSSPTDMLLGAIYEQEGDFEKALARYANVIEREKDNMLANAPLVLLYQRMEKKDDDVLLAVADIAAEIAKQSGNNLSMLQESLKLYEESASQYQLSNPQAAAKNLLVLARMQNELKSAIENALRQGGLKGLLDKTDVLESGKKAYPNEEHKESKVDIRSLEEALRGSGDEACDIPQETEEEEILRQPQYAEPQDGLEAEGEELDENAAEAEEDSTETEITEYAILELLEYLRGALLFLPEEDQVKYRKSDERMLMEHVIAKLSGRSDLHEKGEAKSDAQEMSESAKNNLADLTEALSFLVNLSAELPDKDVAVILGKRTETVQERLKSLEEKSRQQKLPPQA